MRKAGNTLQNTPTPQAKTRESFWEPGLLSTGCFFTVSAQKVLKIAKSLPKKWKLKYHDITCPSTYLCCQFFGIWQFSTLRTFWAELLLGSRSNNSADISTLRYWHCLLLSFVSMKPEAERGVKEDKGRVQNPQLQNTPVKVMVECFIF